jgi:enamine deaminase RidA (YjgF/YER057c/UK114 family)
MSKVTLLRSNNSFLIYSYGSIIDNKNIIHLAGSCPIDVNGIVPIDSSIEEQTALCIKNLYENLNNIGANIENIAYTRVIVATNSRDDLVRAWNEYLKTFSKHRVPSTLFGVSVLGYSNQLVEIECVIAVDDNE